MEKLILRDKLAIERTKLANERTFLAYFRTGIFFLATGLSVLHIEFFSDIAYIGWVLIGLAPLLVGIGLYRLHYTRKTIQKLYLNGLDEEE